MADILIDTDILIDVARGAQEAINYLQQCGQQLISGISSITQMELLIGCRNRIEQQQVEQFIQRFELLKLSEQIADVAINLLRQYRLSHGLLIPDALIAATALSLDKPLATKNQRDYRFMIGLQLLTYP